jgi:hypothetical protein
VLAQQIGQAVANAVAQVLQQVPVQVAQLKCATCVLVRAQWASAHAVDIKAAGERMETALASFPQDHPIRGQADLAAFLPPHLQPGAPGGVPPVQDGAVMTAGTIVCGQHVPGIPQAGGGRKEFLIANAALSSQMLAEMRAA